MSANCPRCFTKSSDASGNRPAIRFGSFYRISDRRVVRRYRCPECGSTFSDATSDPCRDQKKRQVNDAVGAQLVSTGSQRQTARILKLNRKTVVRKFLFLSAQARVKFDEANLRHPLATVIEFDDLETFEHTKMKPLSVTLAVEFKTRRILGFAVSVMPATGRLAKKSRAKYGRRKDARAAGRKEMFESILPLVEPTATVKSDQNPHYPKDVRRYFPRGRHVTVKGKRGAVTGQGELKKIGFDPLFSLNHTFAMLRAFVSRLIRRTWNTTKKLECLGHHIALYSHYHNERLKEDARRKALRAERLKNQAA